MAMTYRGAALPSFVRVKSVNFMVLPTINLATTKIPQRTGLVYGCTTLGERKISLEVAIVKMDDRSPMELCEELAVWLRGTDLKGFSEGELVLDDNPTKLFYAVVSSEVPISDLISVGEGTIEFLLANPYSYSTVMQNDVSYETPAFTVNYNGTAPCYPIIKFTIATGITDPRIDDAVTGESIKIVGSFSSGTTIEINCGSKKIKVNGVLAMDKIDLASDWIYLSKYKTNSFSTVPSMMTTSVELTYREAYL